MHFQIPGCEEQWSQRELCHSRLHKPGGGYTGYLPAQRDDNGIRDSLGGAKLNFPSEGEITKRQGRFT